jgi:C4-dicarboxylate-specific signal transduction histidine kinase
VFEDKKNIIQNLTGINSSKKNYYIELKKKNSQILKQNTQLEIINKLAKNINVDMSITEMMASVVEKLRQVFTFQVMELYLLQDEELTLKVRLPEMDKEGYCSACDPHKKKLLWEAVKNKKSILHQLEEDKTNPRLLIIVPLITKNKVIGVLTTCKEVDINVDESDLTFNEQLADQLAVCIENAQLYEEVKEKLAIEAQLRQSTKLAAIGQMAAGVAHELNNPLTAILGNAQLLMRQMGQQQREKQLTEDIYNCSLRCKKIIEGLLTFSRQEKQPFSKIDLNHSIERVLSLIGYQIDTDKIKLTVRQGEDIPHVTGSSQMIEQVIINLVLNAKDALSEIENPVISLRTECCNHPRLGSCVVIAVSDNGPGISKDNLANIFNPFFTTKAIGAGTGLGLPISLGIAEAHGGTIDVESKENAGSTFALIIPV